MELLIVVPILLIAWLVEHWWIFVPGGVFWFLIFNSGCHHHGDY